MRRRPISALPEDFRDDEEIRLAIHPLLAMVKIGTGEIRRETDEMGEQIIAALIALPGDLEVDEVIDSAYNDLAFWYRAWEAGGRPTDPDDEIDFYAVLNQALRPD